MFCRATANIAIRILRSNMLVMRKYPMSQQSSSCADQHSATSCNSSRVQAHSCTRVLLTCCTAALEWRCPYAIRGTFASRERLACRAATIRWIPFAGTATRIVQLPTILWIPTQPYRIIQVLSTIHVIQIYSYIIHIYSYKNVSF